jgi:hypothetical protein
MITYAGHKEECFTSDAVPDGERLVCIFWVDTCCDRQRSH